MSSQTAPRTDNAATVASPKGPLPPEEKFWQRYSPRQELTLSGVGSFTLHFLAIGFVMLMAIGVIQLSPTRKLAVEMAPLSPGGIGDRGREERNVGTGAKRLEEDVIATDARQNNTSIPAASAPVLQPARSEPAQIDFPDDNHRFITIGDDAKKSIGKLDRELKIKLRQLPAQRPKGLGGDGTPGRSGSRPPGTVAPLTPREQRRLRWVMTLDTTSPHDYLNQLAGLGAVLAIPTGPGDPPAGYFVIRNLKERRGQLKEEDLNQFHGICWEDRRRDSVASVLRVLALKGEVSHIKAFLPQELEEKLFRMELKYRGWKEDDIYETQFKVHRVGGPYEPYVSDQTRKE